MLPVITHQITHFRDFLVASWPVLDLMMKQHDWEDDGWFSDEWIQVNWEFLVERELLGGQGYLISLDDRKRITFPETSATYKVVCEVGVDVELRDRIKHSLNFEGEELLMSGFCSRYEQTTFGLYPTFDFVYAKTSDRKKIYAVPLDSCKFWIESITPQF